MIPHSSNTSLNIPCLYYIKNEINEDGEDLFQRVSVHLAEKDNEDESNFDPPLHYSQ